MICFTYDEFIGAAALSAYLGVLLYEAVRRILGALVRLRK